MIKQHFTGNQPFIIAISFISALGGYLFGFDFAVISGALPFLRTEFGLDVWEEGFLTGSLGLGCIAGCLFIWCTGLGHENHYEIFHPKVEFFFLGFVLFSSH